MAAWRMAAYRSGVAKAAAAIGGEEKKQCRKRYVR